MKKMRRKKMYISIRKREAIYAQKVGQDEGGGGYMREKDAYTQAGYTCQALAKHMNQK